MSQLVIKDLPKSEQLDRAALSAILGGFGPPGAWAVAFTKPVTSAGHPGGLFNVTNNYIDNDYTLIQQNPTNISVFNGAGNNGSIVNFINATPFSVSAASPITTLLGA
jgi:hypothetical protein